MAWTDAARQAAAEARKNHSKGGASKPGSGFSKQFEARLAAGKISPKIAASMLGRATTKMPLRTKAALQKAANGGK